MGVFFGEGINEGSSLFDIGGNGIVNETYGVEELLIVSEISTKFTDEEISNFLASHECNNLLEAGVVSKKSLMRLSKEDDLKRRTKLAALQIAQNKNDSNIKKIMKMRYDLERAIGKIVDKYYNVAEKEAKLAQKEYFKKAPTLAKKLSL